jgi:hypothetical protein
VKQNRDAHRLAGDRHDPVGVAQSGDEMERGHQSWDQHRGQDQYQYRDWEEHRLTYISSAKRIAAFVFLNAARRCAILAR